jgi:hypothetical protein
MECQKDYVYLLEEKMLLEQEILKEKNRKPAIIRVVDIDKMFTHDKQYNVLPF